MTNDRCIRVNDIFESISGEAGGFPQGTWMSGIRLQGCNLLCSYCDSPQAQSLKEPIKDVELLEIPEILRRVPNKNVLVTGGEPLLQLEAYRLITALLSIGKHVQVETNGSIVVPYIPKEGDDGLPRLGMLSWVIDRKGPSSEEMDSMLSLSSLSAMIRNIKNQGWNVALKWVVGTPEDMAHAIFEIEWLREWFGDVSFIMSPVDANGEMLPAMAEVLREADQAFLDEVIFSVQLHKWIKMP